MAGSEEEGVGVRAAKILYPLFVGQGFGVIFTALTFIVVARLLGPSQYGIYTFAFGFSTLVNGFLAFGVGAYFSTALARLAYQKDGRGILRALTSGYVISGSISLLLTIFGIGISGYLASLYTHIIISPVILMVAAGSIIFNVLNTLAVSALIGFSRTGLASIVNVLVDILQLGLSVVLAIKFGVIGAVAAMLIGYLIGAIIGAYLVIRVLVQSFSLSIYIPSMNDLRGVFGVVWPLAATNFLNTGMQNFSILFLGLYIGTASLGNYGAASKGLALLSMLYGAFGSGLLPIFTTAKAMDKGEGINSTYNRIIHFALIPMLPIIMFVGVMSAPGLYLLVGGKYATAPFFLTLIALGTMIGLFGTYISELLISGGHTKSVMMVNFVSAIFQLVFMILLVPQFQVIGAIFTIFFLGNIIEAIFFARDANAHFGIKLEGRKLFLLYLTNLVLGAILLVVYTLTKDFVLLGQVSLIYAAELAIAGLVAIAIYPALLILFRAMDEKDIVTMRHATNRLGRVSRIFDGFFGYSQYLYGVLVTRRS